MEQQEGMVETNSSEKAVWREEPTVESGVPGVNSRNQTTYL